MGYAKMSDFRVWHFFCYINDVVPNTMSFRRPKGGRRSPQQLVFASLWMTISEECTYYITKKMPDLKV
jgi:hypothetical protein